MSFLAKHVFLKRTSSACVDGRGTLISGWLFYFGTNGQEKCEGHCKLYIWCKGVMFGSSLGYCRLLTNNKWANVPGWVFTNGGWAEPNQWKDGQIYGDSPCYEKVMEGKAFGLSSTDKNTIDYT